MTHQKFSLFSLFLLALLAMAQPALAQDDRDAPMREHEETERPARVGFASHLWYGGGIGLNYYSTYDADVNLNYSVFAIGLSPMVGYKFNRILSVGPRVAFNFNNVKYQGYKSLALYDVDAGVFVRARIFRGLFAQGELSNQWIQSPYQLQPDRTVSKISSQRFNQRFGLGYNFGDGGPGSELAVFYNFAIANDEDAYEQPFEIRFAITFGY